MSELETYKSFKEFLVFRYPVDIPETDIRAMCDTVKQHTKTPLLFIPNNITAKKYDTDELIEFLESLLHQLQPNDNDDDEITTTFTNTNTN